MGADYVVNGTRTLTFGPGQTTMMVPLAVIEDGLVEANETVVLTLSNPTGGATLGPLATATVTITDNDRTSTVQLARRRSACWREREARRSP
jgi:hypothetical protein